MKLSHIIKIKKIKENYRFNNKFNNNNIMVIFFLL